MSTFHLKVVTADQCFYEGEVRRIVVRTTQGDIGILPNHIPYVAALGIGGLTIFEEGTDRTAAISGGFVQTDKAGTTVLARTCEWADEIDINRAREAAERAKSLLHQQLSEHEQKIADIKLKKAINRMRIAGE